MTTSEPKPTKGVIYLAIGKDYAKEAIKSASSFKKVCNNIPITIYTNYRSVVEKEKGLFDSICDVDMKEMKDGGYKLAPYAKLNKIKAMASFPYDVTLYLDCDTKIRKSIEELFDFEGKYDMCIANSPKLDKSVRPYKLVDYHKKGAYNSGVIVYRKNDKIRELFGKWLENCKQDRNIYVKYNGKFFDQPKLVELLNRDDCDIKLKVLENKIYNVRHTMIDKVKKDGIYGAVKIVHKH